MKDVRGKDILSDMAIMKRMESNMRISASDIMSDVRLMSEEVKEVEDRDIKDLYAKVVDDAAWEDLEDAITDRDLYDKFAPVVKAYKELGVAWEQFIQSLGPF